MPTLDDYFAQLPELVFNMNPDGLPEPGFFHYTTFAGLLGIFNSEALHATNIHYLNDFTEFKHGLDLARTAIERRAASASAEYQLLLKEISDRTHRIRAVNIFVSSFSSHDDILSQWRGYSIGSGASVAFRFETLREIAERNEFVIVKCVYDDDEKLSLIAAALDEAFATSDPVNEFIGRIFVLAAAFKHHSFKEEGEWRLISKPKPSNDERIFFRATPSMLVPYFAINLDILLRRDSQNRKVLGFGQVRIGPNSANMLAVNAVQSLTLKNKIQLNSIVKSAAPYRTSI